MVEYLEIFGKEYPVRIGYYVMKKVKEETGITFSEAMERIEDKGEIEIHETILYAALEMGQYAEHGNKEVELDKDNIAMALDVCFSDYLQLFDSDTFFPKELRDKVAAQQAGNGQKGQKKPQRKKPQRT